MEIVEDRYFALGKDVYSAKFLRTEGKSGYFKVSGTQTLVESCGSLEDAEKRAMKLSGKQTTKAVMACSEMAYA